MEHRDVMNEESSIRSAFPAGQVTKVGCSKGKSVL